LNITLINDNIDEDIELIKSLLLLEFLAGSRAYVKNFKAVYRSKTKSLIFVAAVNTRKAKLMNFIDLFVSSGIPFFESRYVKINEKINNKSATYSLGWKDMNVFHNIPEAFYK